MLPYLRRSESMSIFGTNDVICRAIWRCLTSLPYQFSIFDDVVGWQPCITFKSSPWVQGAKCYIIAPAFQRLYERKIGTLKTSRLIEGGRLVQGRSQGRVYFLSVKNIEISLYACSSSTVASTFNPSQYFLSLEIPKQISYSFWSYSCIIYTRIGTVDLEPTCNFIIDHNCHNL